MAPSTTAAARASQRRKVVCLWRARLASLSESASVVRIDSGAGDPGTSVGAAPIGVSGLDRDGSSTRLSRLIDDSEPLRGSRPLRLTDDSDAVELAGPWAA